MSPKLSKILKFSNRLNNKEGTQKIDPGNLHNIFMACILVTDEICLKNCSCTRVFKVFTNYYYLSVKGSKSEHIKGLPMLYVFDKKTTFCRVWLMITLTERGEERP
jgi:hypothetical protein